jgi:hypothetical protein
VEPLLAIHIQHRYASLTFGIAHPARAQRNQDSTEVLATSDDKRGTARLTPAQYCFVDALNFVKRGIYLAKHSIRSKSRICQSILNNTYLILINMNVIHLRYLQ